MNYENIGSLIAELRKEKGMTQKELAEKLMVTDRAVSKWERGRGCPNISLLDDLSRILDISVIEILKGRRLDKDEITDNKDLIETMTFTEENLQFKINNTLIKIFLSIAVFLMLLVAYVNLRVYISKTIDYRIQPIYQSDLVYVEIHDNKKEIILSSQGNYSDDEYAIIVDYVKKTTSVLNGINFNDYISKDRMGFEKLKTLSLFIGEYSYSIKPKRLDMYKVLIGKNSESFDRVLSIEASILSFPGDYYLFDLRNVDIDQYKSSVYYLEEVYKADIKILDEIIKVGELNE